MTPPALSDDRETIRQRVKRINEAWRHDRTEELNQYFHPDMIIVGPGFKVAAKGKAACVKSYEDFVHSAMVHEYRDTDPVVEVWGSTAVATYDWEVVWEVDGEVSREVGHDQFVFTREDDEWRAVWRAVLFFPKQS